MTGNKTRYLNFCQIKPVPLHGQPWWLDALCGPEHWDVAITENAGGEITGTWPYYFTRRLGLSIIQLPLLSAYGGPWLQYPGNSDLKLPSKYEFEQHVCAGLLQQLPPTAFFRQNLYPEWHNGLPFHWAGYHLHTRYTYRFPTLSAGWSTQMDSGTRNKIKQAARDFRVEMTDDLAIFEILYQTACARNGRTPVAKQLLQSLDQAAATHQARHIFLARHRQSGQVQAAQYLTRDTQRAYGLLTGFEPNTPLNQANYLLYATVLDYCAAQGLAFDFEGSLDASVGHVFRKMGAVLTPYLQIWKGWKGLEIAAIWGR